jgi:N-acetylmuramoyl-L-alanine amidase
MQAAAPNLAEAITPSQLKKMLAKTEWIEIVANDELGNPYTGPCRIQLPDGSIREGNFDEQGLWGDYDIDPGKCQLLLPDVPEAAAPGVMPAWIGLDLIDEQGAPVVGAAYQVTGSDSTVQSGVLDDDGKARVTGLVPGPCDISFPDFDSTEWIPNAKPPSTGQIHTVDDGEHVAAIAAQFGFRSFNTIWDHPKNAELKSRRKNPHVLQPGDEIFIPDHGKDTASGMTGAFHSYTLKGEALKLRLKLLSILGEPLTGATCTLTVNGVDSEITSNDKGIITAPLPPDTRSATLVAEKQTYTLVVGGLDPIDTPAGLHARLANLGYDLGAEEENDDDDDGAFDPERLQFALELFQSDQQLPITSQANEQTKQRIEQVAGS